MNLQHAVIGAVALSFAALALGLVPKFSVASPAEAAPRPSRDAGTTPTEAAEDAGSGAAPDAGAAEDYANTSGVPGLWGSGGTGVGLLALEGDCDLPDLDVIAADGRRWTTRLYRHRIAYIRTTESGAALELGEDLNNDGVTGAGDDVWQDDVAYVLLPGTRWVFNWRYATDSTYAPWWPAASDFELRAVKGTYYSGGGPSFPPKRHVSNSAYTPDQVDSPSIGFCLDIENNSQSNHAVAQVFTCQGTQNQRFFGYTDTYQMLCWNAIGLAFRADGGSWSYWSPYTSGVMDGRNLRFMHSSKCLNIPNGCIPTWQGVGCEEIELQQYTCGYPVANPNETFYYYYPGCKYDGDLASSDNECCSYQRPDGSHCGTNRYTWQTKAYGQSCVSNIQCTNYSCVNGICGLPIPP